LSGELFGRGSRWIRGAIAVGGGGA